MGRTRNIPPVPAESNLDLQKIEEADQAARQLGRLQDQAADAAQAIALQVGYDGTLTVGALEDEIRFYQRRTVEACLELGKRLLVLKELTPHGQFGQRLDLLGFTQQTAQRFMQAAAKTAKSPNLGYLSTQVKSMSTFLELVTHDDDVLDEFSKLDAIDKMSVSEVRARCRELEADKEAQSQVLDATQKKLTELQVRTSKKIAVDTDWPDALAPITEQIAAAGRKMATALSELETCRITLFEVAQQIPDEGRPKYDAALGHVAEVYEEALLRAERTLQRERVTYDKSLGLYNPETA